MDQEGSAGKPAAPPKPKKTRLNPDYEPSVAAKQWVRDRCSGITAPQADLSTRKFLDHYVNGKGNRETRVDWNNTWQNWVETDYQRTAARPSAIGGPRRSTTDDAVAQTLAMAQRYAQADSEPTRLGIAR